MSLNGVDPSAKAGSRVRRNWARTTKGAIASTIPAVQPIAISGTGNLTLNLATNPGLTPSGQALSILLPASSGLTLGATGLKLLLTTNSGLQLTTTGIGIGAVTTKGDLLGYGTFPTRLGVGTNDQILIADSTQTLGVKWGSSIGNLTVTGTATIGTLAVTGIVTNGTFFAGAVGGTPTAPTFRAIAANDLPGLLNDTNFGNVTITSSLTLPNQNANLVYAGPTTGAGNHPTFRSLVVADLPGGNWIGNTNSQSVLGSSFSITAARGTYQDTGLTVTLPAAGTYLVSAQVRGQIVSGSLASGQANFIVAKLFNTTDSADVANSELMISYVANQAVAAQTFNIQATATLSMIVTVSASKAINLYAKGDGDVNFATATVASSGAGRTILGYVRIA